MWSNMRKCLLLATLSLLVLQVFLAASRGDGPARPQSKPAVAAQASGDVERERLLAIGKKIFVERCASCHNERGDKPLSSSLPLNERKLTREEIARNAAGRLRGRIDEEKLAVTLYIESFMKK